jgi:hypothetical protein
MVTGSGALDRATRHVDAAADADPAFEIEAAFLADAPQRSHRPAAAFVNVGQTHCKWRRNVKHFIIAKRMARIGLPPCMIAACSTEQLTRSRGAH